MPSAARTRGWDIFWISRCPNAWDRRARARLHSPLFGDPGRFENCRLVLSCWIATGGGRCRHQMFFARSSASELIPHLQSQPNHGSRVASIMDERFAENCRKEAEDCRREAQRAMSPLDKQTWLRLAAEWTKLAEAMPSRGAHRRS